MGRSHNTGRTNSVVMIYPARGREHSVLTAHVPPPAFPSRGIAGRALSLPSVLDTFTACYQQQKHDLHAESASRTFQPKRVCEADD